MRCLSNSACLAGRAGAAVVSRRICLFLRSCSSGREASCFSSDFCRSSALPVGVSSIGGEAVPAMLLNISVLVGFIQVAYCASQDGTGKGSLRLTVVVHARTIASPCLLTTPCLRHVLVPACEMRGELQSLGSSLESQYMHVRNCTSTLGEVSVLLPGSISKRGDRNPDAK